MTPKFILERVIRISNIPYFGNNIYTALNYNTYSRTIKHLFHEISSLIWCRLHFNILTRKYIHTALNYNTCYSRTIITTTYEEISSVVRSPAVLSSKTCQNCTLYKTSQNCALNTIHYRGSIHHFFYIFGYLLFFPKYMKNKIGILENDIYIFPIVNSVIC